MYAREVFEKHNAQMPSPKPHKIVYISRCDYSTQLMFTQLCRAAGKRRVLNEQLLIKALRDLVGEQHVHVCMALVQQLYSR